MRGRAAWVGGLGGGLHLAAAVWSVYGLLAGWLLATPPTHLPPPPTHSTLYACRDRLAKGEKVDDDLSDLSNPDLLAELAAAHKLEAAAEAADEYERDDDPYGATQVHESGALRCLGPGAWGLGGGHNNAWLGWGRALG